MTRPSEGLAWWEKVGLLDRLRHRLRIGFRHVRGGWWQILQTAVAAGIGWVLATLILGHEEPPVFASIAAVISLGLARGRRPRRKGNLAIGGGGGGVGGCTALLINALLPIDPERMVRTAAHPVFDESVAVLEETAAALEEGDPERAQNALGKARAIDDRVSGFKEALAAGRETARISPPRRRALGHLELYAAAADQIDLTVRHMRILARDALGVVRTGRPAPEPLTVALRDLARATEAFAAYLETPESSDEARRLALKAAEGASALLREREELAKDLATNALVDEIFSAAYDLLLGTGMDPAAALPVLKEAVGHPLEPS